jgi:hypothetical protein
MPANGWIFLGETQNDHQLPERTRFLANLFSSDLESLV